MQTVNNKILIIIIVTALAMEIFCCANSYSADSVNCAGGTGETLLDKNIESVAKDIAEIVVDTEDQQCKKQYNSFLEGYNNLRKQCGDSRESSVIDTDALENTFLGLMKKCPSTLINDTKNHDLFIGLFGYFSSHFWSSDISALNALEQIAMTFGGENNYLTEGTSYYFENLKEKLNAIKGTEMLKKIVFKIALEGVRYPKFYSNDQDKAEENKKLIASIEELFSFAGISAEDDRLKGLKSYLAKQDAEILLNLIREERPQVSFRKYSPLFSSAVCEEFAPSDVALGLIESLCSRQIKDSEDSLFSSEKLQCIIRASQKYFPNSKTSFQSLEWLFYPHAKDVVTRRLGLEQDDEGDGDTEVNDFKFALINKKFSSFLENKNIDFLPGDGNYFANHFTTNIPSFIKATPDSNGNYLLVVDMPEYEFVSANYLKINEKNGRMEAGEILDDSSWSNNKIGNGLSHPNSNSQDSELGTKIIFRIPSKDIDESKEKRFVLKFRKKSGKEERLSKLTFPALLTSSDQIKKYQRATEAIKRSSAPPYDAFWKDGIMKGLWVVGNIEQNCDYQVAVATALGFKQKKMEVVQMEKKLLDLISNKDIDYMLKSAHSNGSKYSSNLLKGCEPVNYYKFTKEKKEMHILCNPKDYCTENTIDISYKDFFEAIRSRKSNTPLYQVNLSCSSDSKAAFEMVSVGDLNKLQEISTHATAYYAPDNFVPEYFDTYAGPAMLRMLDNGWDYARFEKEASKINPETKKSFLDGYNLSLPTDEEAIKRWKTFAKQIISSGKTQAKPIFRPADQALPSDN